MARRADPTWKVKKSPQGNGNKHWVIVSHRDGKRYRAWFDGKTEAKDEADRRNVQLQQYGTRTATSLTVAELENTEKTLALLEPYGISLQEAAKLAIERRKAERASILIKDLWAACEAAYRNRVSDDRTQLAPRHLNTLQRAGRKLVAAFGDRLAIDITGPELKVWIEGLPLSTASRNQIHANVSVIFSYGVYDLNKIAKNPLLGVKKLPNKPNHKADIVSVEEAIKILKATPEELIPFITIAMFTGARTSEVERLNWDLVDFEKGVVNFPKHITKKSIPKNPDILPNLSAWLAPFKGRTGMIAPPQRRLKRYRKAIRQEMGWKKWRQNFARHSFGAYHLAAYEDAGKTAKMMGHQDPRETYDSYFTLVTRDPGHRYFSIYPPPPPEEIHEMIGYDETKLGTQI